MIPFTSKKSKLRLKILAWYQIVGGILGILLTIWIVARIDQVSGSILIIILFAVGLYGFSILCGRWLLNDKYQTGLKLSIINQAMQIFSFSLLGYGFRYISGVMLLGSVAFSHGFDIGINFSLASTWNIDINTDEKPFVLAINFVAIYWVYFADKLRATIKDEQLASPVRDSQEPTAEDTITDPA